MKMKILVVEILEHQIYQLKRVGEVNDFTNANCDIEVDSNNDDSPSQNEMEHISCNGMHVGDLPSIILPINHDF